MVVIKSGVNVVNVIEHTTFEGGSKRFLVSTLTLPSSLFTREGNEFTIIPGKQTTEPCPCSLYNSLGTT